MVRSFLIHPLRHAYHQALYAGKKDAHTSIPTEGLTRNLSCERPNEPRGRQSSRSPTASNQRRLPNSQESSVLVVGAGLAGLTTAYRLRQAGVIADVVESSGRVGGRVESVPGAFGTELTAELGAEFIDSNHCCLLSLAEELGLSLGDRTQHQPELVQTTLFFAGQRIAVSSLATAFAPAVSTIRRDRSRLSRFRTYQSNCPAATALDRCSLAEYLEKLPLPMWVRRLIEVAYTVEFGREIAEQSCLNFLYLIGLPPQFELLGTCDERFYIAGGNDQVAHRLAAKVSSQIELDTALVSLSRCSDGYYRATLQSGQRIEERRYEQVVLTIPFSVLRSLDLRLALPPAKRLAIDTLGYGTNAKLTTGYREKVWQLQHHSTAHVFTDAGFQNTWESDLGQRDSSGAGLLTTYMGGQQGWALSALSPDRQMETMRPQWEQIFPGLAAAQLPGALARPWARAVASQGSYAAYRVGQWTQLYGVERERVDNLFFAGEHCSVDYQACMEGACQSAEQVASELLQSRSLVANQQTPQQRYGTAFRQGHNPLPFAPIPFA